MTKMTLKNDFNVLIRVSCFTLGFTFNFSEYKFLRSIFLFYFGFLVLLCVSSFTFGFIHVSSYDVTSF